MATYQKFNNFTNYLVGNVSGQVIAFGSDTFKIMLSNTAPVATNTKYSDISTNELASGSGYTTGGTASTVSAANSSGTETITAADVTFTATGSMGPFRYAVFYDTTPTDKPLVCWFDYGSSITLASGESFTVEPNSASPNGTLFTLA
jgi:flagellar capping protein FliD